MSLHDRNVQRIPGRDVSPVAEEHVRRALDIAAFDREHLIDDAQHGGERRLNGVEPSDRDVSVQNLLQDPGIRHETLGAPDGHAQDTLGCLLVRMDSPYQVHRDVRVDEDHDDSPP